MREPDAPSPDEAFWRFSIGFYTLPAVAEALIVLQDRDGLDINLMLFALWLGISGRRLGPGELMEAERATRTIRSDLVEPLRRLRRRLKHHPDEDVRLLRERVKALELAGEKLVQTRLGRVAGRGGPDLSPEDRLAAAHENLMLCIGPERMRCDAARVILEALAAHKKAG